MNILGLIPARGGSLSIPRKNIVLLAGRPLLAYTCEAVLQSKRLTRTILSTDDEQIAEVGRACGVQVPFLRPVELALDETPMVEVVRHAIAWLNDHEGYSADLVAVLQPTSPFRRAEHIDDAVALLESSGADTVVSVVEVPHNMIPESLMVERNGWLQPLMAGVPLLRRQDKPRYLARNGPAVLVTRTAFMRRCADLYAGLVAGYCMSAADSLDIDTEADLRAAERLLSGRFPC